MPHASPIRWLIPALLAALALLTLPAMATPPTGLPSDFPLSPVTWGGLGGAGGSANCPSLTRYPVILVHDGGEGPEVWWQGPDGGVATALGQAGFGPCEIWAIRVGQAGVPQRSLEELTDDLAFFIGSVMAYTGAGRVQILARGDGAVLAHTTLAKYRLHPQVHASIAIDAPFQGVGACDDDACFSGTIRCCSLEPGSLMLRRALLPLETPQARHWDPDSGYGGHLRYLALGSTPTVPLAARSPDHGGWMLDGATNLGFPGLAHGAPYTVEEAWDTIVEQLSDPARACDPSHDQDADGFCDVEHGGADCNDGDPRVHPGADELEADGIDQNCNGHDVDRRFPGWACERPMGDTTPAPPQQQPDQPPAPPPSPQPTTQPEPDTAWLWVTGLLALVLVGGGLMAMRSGRGSGGAGLALLVLMWAAPTALRAQDSSPSQAPTLAHLPAEMRLGVLTESADDDMDAALTRCQRGDTSMEPMPDRHPHAEPTGAHYRDLGFHAPDELDEPFRSALRTMEQHHQGCAKVQTRAGPVILVRFEGMPSSPWSDAQQQLWADHHARLSAAAGLLASLSETARERGLRDEHQAAGAVEADSPVPSPVTTEAYGAFTLATGYPADPRVAAQAPADPITWVDLADAWAYCAWMGRPLPSFEATPDREAPAAVRQWTTSAWDGHRVRVARTAEPRVEDWQLRSAELGFRCVYPTP